MTEAEWLACAEPRLMLEFVTPAASERKARLLAVACCYRIWHLLSDTRSRQAVEVVERYADGLASDEQLVIASEIAGDAFASVPWEPGGMPGAVKLAASAVWGATSSAAEPNILGVNPITDLATITAVQAGDAADDPEQERAAQARLLRDIFGNPFVPPTLDPGWLSWNDGTVRKIAQAIYDDRAFDRLPILADALEDAGCDDADLLAHCRGDGPHVRGCWVVDLLLGKE
jgi:hypothetical protein